MFFKGIKNGDPMHHSADEKLKEGIRRMVTKKAPKDTYQYAENLIITEVRVIEGNKDKDPATYMCNGSFNLKRGDTKKDSLRTFPRTYTCSIQIKDSKDEHNLPDIAVVEFKSDLE